MQVSEEKHKLATRWFHWINFPLLMIMIFSGMLIYWANDAYRIGFGDITLFHFFPNWIYDLTGMGFKLALGMAFHFAFAWLFTINGILYVLYTAISGEWRELVPEKKSFTEALQVALHDMGFKVPLPPQGRYNAAQRITYSLIVVMGSLSAVTGLAIYKPAQLAGLLALLGGYEWARFEHFWLTMGYVGFFAIHIGQVVRAGWPNFRSMVAGFEHDAPNRAPGRRAFLTLGGGMIAAVGGFAWLYPSADDEDIPKPLRAALNFNEKVVRNTLYDNTHLVKTFPASAIGKIRANGKAGIESPLDLAGWGIDLVKAGDSKPSARLTMDDIRQLPRTEEIIEFKCIEGWSTVAQFAGTKFSDFAARFAQGSERAPYVRMSTPDGEYYVGLDSPSAFHPQTLLAWEMNGQPLTAEHGAPLRLVIPVKYGVKNIKRIGRIEFTDRRPGDYWAEQGYDWFAGL